MDLLHELESMAMTQQDNTETDYDDIKRWQSLFGYIYSSAAKKIQDHRSNFARFHVSELHWDIVRAEKNSRGYDKDYYEYSGSLSQTQTSHVEQSTPTKRRKKKSSIYLLTAQATTALPPLFADKKLSATSMHPTLGPKATLPHHHPNSEPLIESDQRLLPTQDQYPLWYFFYGTLADPTVLNNLLGIEPVYRAAKVHGGRLATWGGKFKALVDASAYEKGCVDGHAFLVTNKDQEDALQL
ncbi:uncharacterized protein CCOS01_10839 [Colletotrichum costaricense]|uniref:Gamma-glutamylcyclotransferase AIG2-like domain-containing protein n=1 Tax=Colletotrichum costaricense TaxID=1209916 RepID=A0AAI9YRM3_9PEZI|nr:uncharacterized protein CCOS01_10839 [Colletotrichum costaricense]KAK1520720.1 hypothetical protein CCOS01_10839 [Colletotrichum costaricense]